MAEFSLLTPSTWLFFLVALILVTAGHEMGHRLMARFLRIPVRRLSVGFGPVLWRSRRGDEAEYILRALPMRVAVGVPGRREADGSPRRPLGHDVLMAAGGPAASILLGIVLLTAAALPVLPPAFSLWLIASACISLFLGACNLIPIPGLDGGHLMMLSLAALGVQFSPQQEVKVHRLGIRLAVALCLVFAGGRLTGLL